MTRLDIVPSSNPQENIIRSLAPRIARPNRCSGRGIPSRLAHSRSTKSCSGLALPVASGPLPATTADPPTYIHVAAKGASFDETLAEGRRIGDLRLRKTTQLANPTTARLYQPDIAQVSRAAVQIHDESLHWSMSQHPNRLDSR